ncbi:MAG TPA: DUF2721 domain-containing protein [Longimicrobiaceae bacterium]|nr:DUF2721 domain-containing protein [Longimicrobiaceae bacterium]
MNGLSAALAVLSAMITPAVLISACGSLIIATSSRLGRVIDRTRSIAEEFVEVAHDEGDRELVEEHRTLLFDQLARATRRSRLLQRAMTALYLALSVFVATSVAIGVVGVTGQQYAWIPILLGLGGAGLLFYASLVLILESRITLAAVDDEMDFVWRLGKHHAPSDLVARQAAQRRIFRRRRVVASEEPDLGKG